jgi:hypothetical protein
MPETLREFVIGISRGVKQESDWDIFYGILKRNGITHIDQTDGVDGELHDWRELYGVMKEAAGEQNLCTVEWTSFEGSIYVRVFGAKKGS